MCTLYTVYFVGLWEKYSENFKHIWVASAFKGATGPCVFATDIGFHVENHRAWIKKIKEIQHRFKSVRGAALTGWQRYASSIEKQCFP